MRIACLPIGNLQTPSTWYRIGQYLPHFEKGGIHVDFCQVSDPLDQYDLILNQKNLFSPGGWKKLIRQKRVLFDFDDALWTRPIKPYRFLTQWRVDRRLRFWIGSSAHTLVANSYLADYAKRYSSSVTILPMALDLNVWKGGTQEEGLIGWSGAPHNFHYLEKIEGDLRALKEKFPFVRLAIHSGKRPHLKIPYEYVPFKKGEEHLFIQRLHLGLLPLDSDPYSQGKSPIKALQYMACEVPVVSNLNGSIAAQCEALLTNPNQWCAAALAGRKTVEEEHDLKKTAARFMELLRTVPAGQAAL